MYQYQSHEDTIVAIATAQGPGGIGIVRLSGRDAVSIVNFIFRAKSNKLLKDLPSHQVTYGWIKQDEMIVDEVLVTVMRSPRSYTAEDVVEINCHGGVAAVRKVLELCLNQGARLASPGEFTKRAYLNGRMDLTQAEAVLDIIQATTDAFLRVSENQLQGELSLALKQMREILMGVYTAIEAVINFPEDDIDPRVKNDIIQKIQTQQDLLSKLLANAHQGRLLKDGIRIVLAGKPNVGKSSLLNVLLRQERAIVTHIAGTTRDVLEEQAQIKGIRLHLVDTAGILEPRDLVEEEAIKRSHLYIASADLVLLVVDQSRPLEEADFLLFDRLSQRQVLVVLNKSDLPAIINHQVIPFKHQVSVSAITKDAITQLEDKIIDLVTNGRGIDPQALMIYNLRHIEALKQAHALLIEGHQLIQEDAAWEAVSENIKLAVNHLDAITGRNIDQDLIDRIFNDFCIGK